MDIIKSTENKPYRVNGQVNGKPQRFLSHEHRSNAVTKIQRYGTVRYQPLEKPLFNKVQQRLYAEAIYGLTCLSEVEVAALSNKRKHEIIVKFKKAQGILNQWKQEITNMKVDTLFEKLFPKSPITVAFKMVKGSDDTLKCRLTFKELGINQQMIADKLVQTGVLPSNFYQLS